MSFGVTGERVRTRPSVRNSEENNHLRLGVNIEEMYA